MKAPYVYIHIYTVAENFNYLTAHNPVMTRDTYLPRFLSLSLVVTYYFLTLGSEQISSSISVRI